ncbi:MAG: TIGR00730 family Rossman fold protein [Myxococcota bacterium]|nr:TIGR00730 family Rossman fold protein [Myxococcota bacterium]
MRTFRRICVYCGSSNSVDARFKAAARACGTLLAQRGIGVVYGGGSVGLMGIVADAALAAGGEVLGVIPDKLQALELGHDGLTELFVVDSMHARKMLMAQLSDGFVALPGGFGTIEEIIEVTTWSQLNYHRKPVGLLNVDGYYDHLLAWIRGAVTEGFIHEPHRNLLQAATTPEDLLALLATAKVPELKEWLIEP